MHPFLLLLILQSLCFLYTGAVLAVINAWVMLAFFTVLAVALLLTGIVVYFKRIVQWMYAYLAIAVILLGFALFHTLLLLKIPSRGMFNFSSLVYGQELSLIYKGTLGLKSRPNSSAQVVVLSSLSPSARGTLILALVGYSISMLLLLLAMISTCFLPSLTKQSNLDNSYQCPKEFADPLYKRFTNSFPHTQRNSGKIHYISSPYKKAPSPELMPQPDYEYNAATRPDSAVLPNSANEKGGHKSGYGVWAAGLISKTKGWFGVNGDEEHRPNSHILRQQQSQPREHPVAPEKTLKPPTMEINPASILKHERSPDTRGGVYKETQNLERIELHNPQQPAQPAQPAQPIQAHNFASSVSPIPQFYPSGNSSFGRGTIFKDTSVFTPIVTEPLSKAVQRSELEAEYHALMNQNVSEGKTQSHHAMASLLSAYGSQVPTAKMAETYTPPGAIPNSMTRTSALTVSSLKRGHAAEGSNKIANAPAGGLYNWWFGNADNLEPAPTSVQSRKASRAYVKSNARRAPSKLVTCSSGVMLKCSDCLQLIPLNEASSHHCTQYKGTVDPLSSRDTLIDSALKNRTAQEPIPAVPKIPTEYYFDSQDYC